MTHIDWETLAAFVDGRLNDHELQITTMHLQDCEACREIVAETTRSLREGRTSSPPVSRTWPIAVAVAAVLAVGFFWFRTHQDTDGLMKQLVVASSDTSRPVEPRLSGGFKWSAPRRESGSGTLDPRDMKLIGVAGEVIARATRTSSPAARHAEAVARVLTGGAKDAITTLDSIEPKDWTIWNDLAAAHYVVAGTEDSPAHLRLALAAVDASLESAPRQPEALFNRALIIEHLGLKEPSRNAWRKYLEVDRSSGWSAEARDHLARLSSAAPDFQHELRAHYRAIADGDAQAAHQLVQSFPEQSRTTSEVEILGQWAAQREENPEQATEHLSVARAIGQQLRKTNREQLLSDAVAAIDIASNEQRRLLARAHIDYREARQTYRDKGAIAAEATMRRAVAEFAPTPSPMAFVAQYYLGQILHDEHRIEDANAMLETVERRAAPYQALRAQTAWERGLCHSAEGLWSLAIDNFQTSVSGFSALGEQSHAAFVTELLAEALERVGDAAGAWRARLSALPQIGASNTRQLDSVLNAIAFDAARNSEWRVARSFLDLEEETSPPERTAELHSYALLRRAYVENRLGHLASSQHHLLEAADVAAIVRDPEQRAQIQSQCDAVRAVLEMNTAPREAADQLTRVIQYTRTKGDRTQLPDLLLSRGRAYLEAGDTAMASADFLAGIEELESQRHELAPALRWNIFDVRIELFAELIAVDIRTGQIDRAFALAERSKARSLLERFTHSELSAVEDFQPSHLPADVAIIEPVIANGRIFEFVVAKGLTTVSTVAISASEFETKARNASAALTEGDQTNADARALSRILIDPIMGTVANAATLVFVPPAGAEQIPFAALIDPATARTLVEDHQVVVSPSAAIFVKALERSANPSPVNGRALIVANPAVSGLAQLSAGEEEARVIASMYQQTTTLTRKEATADNFVSGCASASVVHFTGHTLTSHGRIELAMADESPVFLDAEQIAALDLRKTSVVILAGCDTGAAFQEPGEGPTSIAYGFIAAGVPSVIATLRPIDDRDASEFFIALHRRLAAREPPAQALRHTQIDWIRGHKPPIWASVQLFGV